MSFYQKQAAKMLDFLEENGVDSINLAVLEPRKNGEGSCMNGGDRPRGRDEVEKSLAWALARNLSAGANVYFRPARRLGDGAAAAWPLVFLDDLPASVAAGIAKKYRSVIIETSSSNFQAWIVADRPLDEAERYRVQSELARRVGADVGSVSGEHFGRFPGYRNQKPGRTGFWVHVQAINSTGQVLDPAHILAAAAEPAASRSDSQQPSPTGGRVPSRESRNEDESARECRFAVARLAAGHAADSIAANIAARAYDRGKRRNVSACEAYARATVARAAAICDCAVDRTVSQLNPPGRAPWRSRKRPLSILGDNNFSFCYPASQ